MEQNPYAPSQAQQTLNTPPQNSGVPLSPLAFHAVSKTTFWVKLVGIVMFVIVALQLLSILLMKNVNTGGMESSVLIAFIIPLISMVIYCLLATRLIQYGNAITKLSLSKDARDFERAMEMQSKFWKLLGISTLVLIVLGFLAGVLATSAVSRY